jgi:hypothetical protein
MSSAGYHFGAFSEDAGILLDPPFFAPPICFVFGAVDDIVGEGRTDRSRDLGLGT